MNRQTRLMGSLLVVSFLLLGVAQAVELAPDEIVKRYGKAVVLITTVTADGKAFQGTGFFVSTDGLLVTNQHVIRDAVRTQVRLTNGRSYAIRKIVWQDSAADLALLSVNGSGFPAVRLGDPASVKVGSRVYVIGNPEGLENSISDGLLSGRRSDGRCRLLQISAPISPGSSGSPVFNREGKVIGVARAALRDGQNLNFAVPVEYVRYLIAQEAARLEPASDLGQLRSRTRRRLTRIATPEEIDALIARQAHRSKRRRLTRIATGKPKRQATLLARTPRAPARPKPAAAEDRPTAGMPPGTRVLPAKWVLTGSSRWLKWSPDGKRLACAFGAGPVQLWDPETGEEVGCLPDSELSHLDEAAWSPDSRQLASIIDHGVRLWDLSTMLERTITQPDANHAHDLTWSTDSLRLAWIADGRVSVWEPSNGGEPVVLNDAKSGGAMFAAWRPHSSQIVFDTCHPRTDAGQTIRDYGLQVYDAALESEVTTIDGFASGASWSPNGGLLALEGSSSIRILSPSGWQQVAVLCCPEGTALRDCGAGGFASGMWSPDGTRLATTCSGDRIRIWESSTWREVATLADANQYDVHWSPEGRRLAWLTEKEARVKVWDADVRREKPIPALGSFNFFLSWSPDGRCLAAANFRDNCSDGVSIWNLAGGCAAVTGGPPVGGLIEWCPDSKRLAAVCQDGPIRLWVVSWPGK